MSANLIYLRVCVIVVVQVLFSPVGGGKWVTPKDAVLVDDDDATSSNTMLASVRASICTALLCDGVPLVFVPTQLKDTLLKAGTLSIG